MDYNKLKELSYEQLEALVPEGFAFKRRPRKPQLTTFLGCIANDGFLENLDLGLGKTKVAIDVCRYEEWLTGRKIKVLVVCLNNAVEKWASEVAKDSNMRAVCLRGTTKEKWPLIKGDGFFIINFEGLRWLLSEKVATGTSLSGKTVNKQELDAKKANRLLAKKFRYLIIDESHEIKNIKSLNYKIANMLSRRIPSRLCLTGTVFGNTLLDIWTQYYILDFGKTYGTNFFSFRRKYFVDRGFKIRGIWKSVYKPTIEGEAEISKKLWERAIRFSEEEDDSLPESNYDIIDYDLTSEQKSDYLMYMGEEAFDLGIKNRGMVWRQICSGFIKSTGYRYKKNPKLDALAELISQAVQNSKIVIFHEFNIEGEMIEGLCKKMGLKYCLLNGRVKKKYDENMKFENEDQYKVMIAHPKSGGASIDLVAAAYCAFYSNGRGFIMRRQCEKRISRTGQTAPHVFYYDFVGRGTIERTMLNNLRNNRDAFDRIIDGKTLKKALKGEL